MWFERCEKKGKRNGKKKRKIKGKRKGKRKGRIIGVGLVLSRWRMMANSSVMLKLVPPSWRNSLDLEGSIERKLGLTRGVL